MHNSEPRALPPAPSLGTTMTGNVWPYRTYRRQPVQATGRVTRVCSHAIELLNAGGFLMIDSTSAREVRVVEDRAKRKKGGRR